MLLYSYKLYCIQMLECCGQSLLEWAENRDIKWLEQVRHVWWKNKEKNPIEKVVGYKASTYM